MAHSARFGQVLRRLGQLIWVGSISAGVAFYLWLPGSFTAANIAELLQRFQGPIWAIYIAASAFRGMTLLPSTPLVIAGTLIFPQQPYAVFTISLLGILFSSSMIFFFSEFLGLNDYFETHKPELTHRIKQRLENPTGFLFVAAWAFFPLVPTDAVCYAAGSVRMRFLEFIGAVFLGESILCAIYVFFGGSLLGRLR